MCDENRMHSFGESLTVVKQSFDSLPIGINVITIQKYGLKTFSLFCPANTSFFLALVLVPIEFVSYIAKPISLGVRLFINLCDMKACTSNSANLKSV